MIKIDSLDLWNEYEDILHSMGYTVFLLQHDTNAPEGFRIQFILSGCPEVTFVTRNKEVRRAMLKYDIKKKPV